MNLNIVTKPFIHTVFVTHMWNIKLVFSFCCNINWIKLQTVHILLNHQISFFFFWLLYKGIKLIAGWHSGYWVAISQLQGPQFDSEFSGISQIFPVSSGFPREQDKMVTEEEWMRNEIKWKLTTANLLGRYERFVCRRGWILLKFKFHNCKK